MICANDECPDWTVHGVRGEYRADINECPRCGARLVDQLPTEPTPAPAPDESSVTEQAHISMAHPAIVARFNQRHEAELLRGVLAALGIDAVVNSDDCGATDPALGFGREAQLLVDENDAERALAIIADEQSDGD